MFDLVLDSVTTFPSAVGVATVTVDVVSIVAGFSVKRISDSVTAIRKDAIGSASVGGVGVPDTSVTLLFGVDDTITAVSISAVGSASVGETVVVEGAIVAFLSHPGSVNGSLDVFLDSITASAVGDRWETVQNGLQELISGGSLGEEDRQDSVRGGSCLLGFVEELDFEWVSSVSDVVLTGLVEFEAFQGVAVALVGEGSTCSGWEQDLVSGVEEDNWGWVVLNVRWVVQVQSAGSGTSFGETDWRLSVGGALTVVGSGHDSVSSVDLACLAVSFSVAFLSGVLDSITARWGTAGGSASIWSLVVVFDSVVALFVVLHDSVTTRTSKSVSGIVGEIITGGWCGDNSSSVVTLEVSVGVGGDNCSEETALGSSHGSGLWDDEPLDTFGARRSGVGTEVVEGSDHGWQQQLQVDGGSSLSLTTFVEGADGRTSIEGAVGVEITQVALFSEGHLTNSITTVSLGARGGAKLGSVSTVVAFFIGIGESVTAKVSHAVGSASVGDDVAVGKSVVAIFSSLLDSVSAVSSAARATVVVNVVSVVTLFSGVRDIITTVRILAIQTASVGGGVASESSGIALLASEVVGNTITAEIQLAVGTASVGSGVAVAIGGSCGIFVGISVVAGFASVDDSVTASVGAVAEASHGLKSRVIAVFSEIGDVVTTVSKSAWGDGCPRSANGGVGSGGNVAVRGAHVAAFVGVIDTVSTKPCAVGRAKSVVEGVALFQIREQVIHDSVSASWKGTVGSAAVGKPRSSDGVVGQEVVISLVALFTQIGDVVTASGPVAIHTADTSGSIWGVGHFLAGHENRTDSSNSKIALLSWLKASIATFFGAGSGATGTLEPSSGIASFTDVSDTVTAIWKTAVGSALTGNGGIGSSVAFLTVSGVGNSVTTAGELAVTSASIGEILIVDEGTLITSFSPIGVVWLGSVVSAFASVSAWEGGQNFGEETIVALSSTVEQNGNGGIESLSTIGSSVGEVQLDFQGGVSSLEGVLAW